MTSSGGVLRCASHSLMIVGTNLWGLLRDKVPETEVKTRFQIRKRGEGSAFATERETMSERFRRNFEIFFLEILLRTLY